MQDKLLKPYQIMVDYMGLFKERKKTKRHKVYRHRGRTKQRHEEGKGQGQGT